MIQPQKIYYTVEDWLSWDEDVRAELYEGDLYMMAPPSQRHQSVLMEIAAQLHTFLKGKPCRVFPAPFGVRLSDREDTVFEPDIVVVCDKSKLDGKICTGAPDLVIEILSPSTERFDRVHKFQKYQNSGVREYWIIEPEKNYLQVNMLEGGRYVTAMYDENDSVPVRVLDGCVISLPDVFSEE